MSNINTPVTTNQELNMNTNDLITRLFQKYIDNGGTPTSSAFRRHVDILIKTDLKSHLEDAKGKSAEIAGSAAASIKSHFCRGRKWVTIPSDHDSYSAFKSQANSHGFDDLLELWESKGFAWVRFHSTKGSMVNFSIHPNSSVGSNVKIAMGSAAALELEVLNGTPKSNGFEDRVQPKAADPEPEVNEAPVEETADQISPDDANPVEEEVMVEEAPSDEDSEVIDNEAEIQALLAEELDDDLDIDGDFDIDSL
jgi:hypothetical protein